MPVQVQQRTEGGVLVLDVSGSVIAAQEARQLREAIASVLDAGRQHVLLNLGHVTYMDSTGIGVLLGAKTSAIHRGIHLKVCCVPPFVGRLLAQLHLDQILDLYDGEQSALASFDAGTHAAS